MKTVRCLKLVFFIIIYFSAFSVFPLLSQDNVVMKEAVYKESIHSIQLYRDGWKLSYPIIDLNGGLALELGFDDITDNIANYYYKVVHCDFNWTPSNVNEGDYLDGFLPAQITDYSMSFNTYFSYVHFSLKLPNNDFSFRASGNYALLVFEDNDESKMAFVKRFIISDAQVKVKADVSRPVLSMFRNTSHEVNFTIETGALQIENPYNDIKVNILQNGRWDQSISNLKPLYDKSGILEYNYQMENIFPAGNEYRWFDIKSMRYQSPYVKSVEYKNGYFYVTLFPDPIKAASRYFYEEDLNGRYYIEIQEEQKNDTEADYVYVDFSLPYNSQLDHGAFYVMGDLAGNIYSERNKMIYNPQTQSYELRMLLKQGYYNYRYEFLKDGKTAGDAGLTEGNFYETEDDYLILVYYRGSSSRYDRLLGYQIANSLKKN
ncbi:MAG: DUF5103 domain-containing protein [Bacteroidales bacterium]|nr:DUF5103 domain-containing protein [Bacteroidales bacterium]